MIKLSACKCGLPRVVVRWESSKINMWSPFTKKFEPMEVVQVTRYIE